MKDNTDVSNTDKACSLVGDLRLIYTKVYYIFFTLSEKKGLTNLKK